MMMVINFQKMFVSYKYLWFLLLFISCSNENRNTQKELIYSNDKMTVDTLGTKMMWLDGEDGGNWFAILKIDSLQNKFLVKRFYEDKTFYSEGVFIPNKVFNVNRKYKLIPICTDNKLTIIQEGDTILFSKID
jgi:hypothetical protein